MLILEFCLIFFVLVFVLLNPIMFLFSSIIVLMGGLRLKRLPYLTDVSRIQKTLVGKLTMDYTIR